MGGYFKGQRMSYYCYFYVLGPCFTYLTTRCILSGTRPNPSGNQRQSLFHEPVPGAGDPNITRVITIVTNITPAGKTLLVCVPLSKEYCACCRYYMPLPTLAALYPVCEFRSASNSGGAARGQGLGACEAPGQCGEVPEGEQGEAASPQNRFLLHRISNLRSCCGRTAGGETYRELTALNGKNRDIFAVSVPPLLCAC